MSYPGARYHHYHPGTPSCQNNYQYVGNGPNTYYHGTQNAPQMQQSFYNTPIYQEPCGYYHSTPPPSYDYNSQYSGFSGKRKALFIGINYFGTNRQLSGCINDVHNISQFIQERYGYSAGDTVILTDDQTNPRSIPTKKNIIDAMQWLVKDARPNDSFFLHYSGHGGQIDDIDGDEEDGSDEVIYPVDFNYAGYITDDIIHSILVKPLPPGCRLTAIFDCCHSGSIMDLPFTYSTEGKLKEQNLLSDAANKFLREGPSTRGIMGITSSIFRIAKRATNFNNNSQRSKLEKASHAEVVMFSGCKDSQTSVDTSIRNQATGVMSWAFRSALTKIPNQTYLQLLNSIRCELYQKYDQKPQLSCSHPIDLNRMFTL
ncbi:hypothetical protein PCANB_002785 [Pneumocystis canis]|nr:hypothetical protein PCANB_002785 [Pneumocystis canis]